MGLSRYGGNSAATGPQASNKPVSVTVTGGDVVFTTVPLAINVATEAELIAAIELCAETLPLFPLETDQNVITITAPIALTANIVIPNTTGMKSTRITTANNGTPTINSIQSVSGAPGAYTHVLNVDTTLGLLAGAILGIIGGAGAASSPLVNGAALVDVINTPTRLTVLSENQSATTPALATTAIAFRAVNNIITTNSFTFSVANGGWLNFGLIAMNCGFANPIAFSGNNVLNVSDTLLLWQPGDNGFYVNQNSLANTANIRNYITGGGVAGIGCGTAVITINFQDNVNICGALDFGVNAALGSIINSPSHLHISGCGGNGVRCVDGSRVIATGQAGGFEINYCAGTGILAQNGGAVFTSGSGALVTNNGTNFNPAVLNVLSATAALIEG